jgi:uncharacterized protein YbjQ (UPF0145 family)
VGDRVLRTHRGVGTGGHFGAKRLPGEGLGWLFSVYLAGMRDGGFGSMLVVTTEGVPGFEVTFVIGEVCGVAAHGRNQYTAGLKELSGEVNPRMNQKLANARDEAIADMTKTARRRGANAVVGMRFDNREVAPGWSEICAYGTAVRMERIRTRVPRVTGTARPIYSEPTPLSHAAQPPHHP